MATKTFEELKQLAIQIRDEKTNKQNTATRVGTAMLEHINKLEQDYYDKTQTDEELKERDDKLTELEKKEYLNLLKTNNTYTNINGITTESNFSYIILTKGKYLYKYRDEVKEDNKWSYTEDYIDIKKGDDLFVKTSNMVGENACLMFYDINKQAILEEYVDSFNINTETDISSLIPDNAYFLRVSCLVDDMLNFNISIKHKSVGIYKSIDDIKAIIGGEKTITENVDELIKDNTAIRYNTGKYEERTGWKSSDLHYIIGDKINIKASNGGGIFGVAFYEKNDVNTYINGVSNTDGV